MGVEGSFNNLYMLPVPSKFLLNIFASCIKRSQRSVDDYSVGVEGSIGL